MNIVLDGKSTIIGGLIMLVIGLIIYTIFLNDKILVMKSETQMSREYIRYSANYMEQMNKMTEILCQIYETDNGNINRYVKQ